MQIFFARDYVIQEDAIANENETIPSFSMTEEAATYRGVFARVPWMGLVSPAIWQGRSKTRPFLDPMKTDQCTEIQPGLLHHFPRKWE
jgi:hypothetical protein